MADGALDIRIDRDALALEILATCGAQTPRYMDTNFFATMAANFFLIKAREYSRDLDILEAEYNPLQEFNVERHGGTSDTRTDNLTETFTKGDATATHKVSADNEEGAQMRTQDVTSSEDDTTRNTGTQSHIITHNETEGGRNKAAQELLSSEIETNKINIYRIIALDFSDALMVGAC